MKDRLSKAGLFFIDMEKGYNKSMLKKNIRSVKLIRTERGIQMKKDVFQNCPIYQSDRFEIRKMEMKDDMNYFGVTVIPRLPDILTVTAVEMIFIIQTMRNF